MSNPQLPERTHKYRSQLLNSDHWDLIEPRDDDIIVASAYKAGTTWMQTIVANLIFQDGDLPGPVMEISPWIDRYRYGIPISETIDMLEAQTHRRSLKTHLPLDALRFFPKCKYIAVGRDGRDVFMSLWNHHNNYSDAALEGLHKAGEELGVPWPETSKDLREFWRVWLTRSYFPWEHEGYPYWSMFRHHVTWWNYRHLPNLLFVHYDDLLADIQGQIQRVADFLDIPVDTSHWPRILKNVSFEDMRDNGDRIMGKYQAGWSNGANTFFNKGSNGHWRSILSADDLALYDAALERNMNAEAASWLNHEVSE